MADPRPARRVVAVLAEIERGDAEKVVVTHEEYNARPFGRVQVHARDARTGAWVPDRGRTVTVRVREIPKVVGALTTLMRLLGQDRDDAAGPEWLRKFHEKQDRKGR